MSITQREFAVAIHVPLGREYVLKNSRMITFEDRFLCPDKYLGMGKKVIEAMRDILLEILNEDEK